MTTAAPGLRIGPYELLTPVGAGGMGEVWKARDTRLDRIVAIKFSQAQFTDRFEREARAIAALNHPNIAQIYDVGENYIVMEYIDGAPVRAPDSMRKLLDIAVQIADGLAAAHAAGFVHRDLKPDNILITKSGRVKILDFGLARETALSASQSEATQTLATSPGTILGTVAYMSPEQVRGATLDHRSDIFSLGIVLYELVAGSRPFQQATTAETMTAILKQDVPELPASTPPGLRQIVTHALEKDPERRFQSTRDMEFALRALTSPSSDSHSTVPETKESTRRQWLQRGAVAAGATTLTAGAYWLGHRSVVVPAPTLRKMTFRQGTVAKARFTADDQTIVYSALWEKSVPRLFVCGPHDEIPRELNIPDLIELASVSRRNELAVLLKGNVLARVPLSGGTPRKLLENVIAADWSPDGESLAVARFEGGKTMIEYPPGKVLYQINGYYPYILRVSPEGDRIVFIYIKDGYRVATLDRAGKMSEIARFEGKGGYGYARPCWAGSGREVWMESPMLDNRGVIYAFDLRGNRRTVYTLPYSALVQSLSRDGKLLVILQRQRSGLAGIGPDPTEERDLTRTERSSHPLLTPDGRIFVFCAVVTNSVYLRQTDGTLPVRLCEGIPTSISPDGKWVLVFRDMPKRSSIFVSTGPGEEKEFVVDGTEPAPHIVSWLRGDKGFVVTALERGKPNGKSRLYVWRPADHSLRPLSREGITYPVFCDPDNERCLLRVSGGSWMLYPIDGSAPIEVRGIGDDDTPVNFTADGNGIYLASPVGRLFESGDIRVSRVDWRTGRKELWKEIRAPHAARISPANLRMTPDGRSYIYHYVETLSDLFMVEGLS